MLHPSRACRNGFHVTTRIDGQHTRCLWCGLVARVGASDQNAGTAQLPAPPAPPPQSGSDAPLTHTPTLIDERYITVAAIEERFQFMAREYASTSAALRHWQQQGNPLPACYR